MDNRLLLKWKESLDFWSLGFSYQFLSVVFDKVKLSFFVYIKKFWFVIVGIFASLVSLLYLMIDFNVKIELDIFAPAGEVPTVVNRFIAIASSFKGIVEKKLNPKLLIPLIFILIVLIFINSLLPFIITKEHCDEKDYNYINFFKTKLFGLIIKIPIFWGVLFAVFAKGLNYLNNWGFVVPFVFSGVWVYSIYLYSDSSNNKAFKTCLQSLKLFLYTIPAFLYLKFIVFIINSAFVLFLLGGLYLLFLLLGYLNIVFVFILAIILFLAVFNILYFIDLSIANNFYLALKDKNMDILKLEEL